MKKAVLFLIFNRLETTKEVFEQIKIAKPPKLYIASDGPRFDEEKNIVDEVRNWVLENINWKCEVITLFREKNLGCGRAIADAITWFFKQEKDGIILEDDSVPSQSFFNYCEELLDYYKDDKRIWHISGNQFIKNYKNEASYYFAIVQHGCSWATWADRWKYFNYDLTNYDKKYLKNFSENKGVQSYWGNILKMMQQENRNDIWDYQWAFEIVKNKGLCINPSVNLVTNIGIDGTHFTNAKDVNILNLPRFELEKIIHPKIIEIDYKAVNTIYKNVFGIEMRNLISILKIFKRKIFNLLKKIYIKTFRNKYVKLFEKYKKQERFVEKNIKFENIYFSIPDAVSFAYQIKDIFIDECYKFETKKKTPLIYDCGSNVGLSVYYFKKIFPRAKIKAFEADPLIFEYLTKNLKSVETVELFNNAVWINNNEICFNSEGADGGSLINEFNNKKLVKAVRLKTLLSKEKEIDFLKIDIEGAEYDVIIDCSEELIKVDNLFVEYHSINGQDQNLDKILLVIKNAGFRYYLENVCIKKTPFVNKNNFNNMDLQVNIFGYRN